MKQYFVMLVFGLLGCHAMVGGNIKASKVLHFYTPRPVTVIGYNGDIMEPFLSKNGHYLFFNNLNGPPVVNTNIFYAERVNDTVFLFWGEVAGVNSTALDAVASMDEYNNFYFVSTRSYDKTLSTIYTGKFGNDSVSNITIAEGVSKMQPGSVNFDAEISTDGNTLYFADGQFNSAGQLQAANILFALKDASAFTRPANALKIMENINADGLTYAPSIADDGLTLYFTKVDAITATAMPTIFYATRQHKEDAFALPRKIKEIDGFAEAPTLSADNNLLYYHKKENGHFVLYCVKRK